VIYTTACADNGQPGDGSFLPLSIQYMERFSAAGETSGGYIKRDGRQKEGEVLTSRLVDRPLRPMFQEGWAMETQVLQWVLSFDGKNAPEPLAITAAGAALAISDIPLLKPVAAVRVGLVAGEFIVNPSLQQMQSSSLDLIIAGTEDAVLMIEGFCDFLTEDQMLESIQVGADAISGMCEQIQAWADKIGKPKSKNLVLMPENLNQEVEAMVVEDLDKAFRISAKQERGQAMAEIQARVMEAFSTSEDGPRHQGSYVSRAFKNACSKVVRGMVLNEKIRTDGRGLTDVRPIASRASALPVPHGSALFTRGETQVLAVATIGSDKMAQRVDELKYTMEEDEGLKMFYLQYFFPPSSVGETGRVGPPGRREVGHGQLAERALIPVVPPSEDFGYTIRVETNVTESNGSSSMASVCAGCLAMMDAGVPVKEVVAGVAMGLVLEEDGSFVVLTDILGSEDALGDMDFKVAGSENGVTAFQMDIKVEGITIPIMKKALEQAKEGRKHILREMKLCNPPPSGKLSDSVPRFVTVKVPSDKVGKLIGKGGMTVKSITEESGVTNVSIEKDGRVTVTAPDELSLKAALEMIENTLLEVEAGKLYRNCKVKKVADFGCFVEVLPGVEGLVHIKELQEERTARVTDVVQEGDIVDVVCLAVLQNGRLSLSRKAALAQGSAAEAA